MTLGNEAGVRAASRSEAAASEIDLKEVIDELVTHRLAVAVASVFSGILLLCLSMFLPESHRTETLLAPVEDESESGLAALAAQYGGVAQLAGVDVGGLLGASNERAVMAIELLQSRQFLEEFIASHSILVDLMAVTDWERETGVVVDPAVYNIESEEWVRDVVAPYAPQPSLLEAHEVFINDVLEIEANPETGFFTLAISHPSPTIAQQWATWLVEDLNDYVRVRDQTEARELLLYLESKLEATRLAGMRQVLFQLVEEQMKRVMLTEVRKEYVFRTLDRPFLPEESEWPASWAFALLGVLTGLVASFLVVTVRLIFS